MKELGMINPIEHQKPGVLQIPAIVNAFKDVVTNVAFLDPESTNSIASMYGQLLELSEQNSFLKFRFDLRGCFIVVELSDKVKELLANGLPETQEHLRLNIAHVEIQKFVGGKEVSLDKAKQVINPQPNLNLEVRYDDLEYSVIKVGRRSKTLYLAILATQGIANLRMVIFGGVRNSNRIRMYNEILKNMIDANQNFVDSYYTQLDLDTESPNDVSYALSADPVSLPPEVEDVPPHIKTALSEALNAFKVEGDGEDSTPKVDNNPEPNARKKSKKSK